MMRSGLLHIANQDSPERGGATVTGGRRASLPATNPRQPKTSLRAPVSAAVEAREPASPRHLPCRAGWQWLRDACERLNESRTGDAIGLACLIGVFLIAYIATP